MSRKYAIGSPAAMRLEWQGFNPYESDAEELPDDLTESEAKAAHDARALERGLARRENREGEENL